MSSIHLPTTTISRFLAPVGIAGLLALAPLFIPVVHAGTTEGIEAFEAGDYERAYKEFRLKAEAEDAEAQYYLGSMYARGFHVDQDFEQAREWISKASASGHVRATSSLGYIYDEGLGIPVDDTKAVELYLKAAESGSVIAQRNLGLMYREGEGIEKNYKQAARWFRHAAEQGDAVAQTELGQMYWMERGVEEDIQQSLTWLRRGAEQDHAEAQYLLCSKYTSLYSPRSAELVEGMKWCKLSADQDYPSGVKMWDAATHWFISEEQKARSIELARQWRSEIDNGK